MRRQAMVIALAVLLGGCGDTDGTATEQSATNDAGRGDTSEASAVDCSYTAGEDVFCEGEPYAYFYPTNGVGSPAGVPEGSLIETGADGIATLHIGLFDEGVICTIDSRSSVLTRVPDDSLFTQRWGTSLCYSLTSGRITPVNPATLEVAATVDFSGEVKVQWVPGVVLQVSTCIGSASVAPSEVLFPDLSGDPQLELQENQSVLLQLPEQEGENPPPDVSEEEEQRFVSHREAFGEPREGACNADEDG